MSPEMSEVLKSIISALLFIFILFVIVVGGIGSIYLMFDKERKQKELGGKDGRNH